MTEIKNYREALEFLYGNLPMFQRQGAPAMKKDLRNIRLLCNVLGDPQDSLQCIHVGGTNGKGSVSHMLSAMLQSQGKTVGWIHWSASPRVGRAYQQSHQRHV